MIRDRSIHGLSSPVKYTKLRNDGEPRENMWSSLLDSVASGKRLPEKTVLVLGGSSETQKDFLETLASDTSTKPPDRHRTKPPIANEFALGYTYQDVLDTDHEDTLARLSIYTLSEPLDTFAPLLRPLFTTHTIPDTLLLVLLDWTEPWNWVRQLRNWIQLLRGVLTCLESDATEMMAKIMQEWQQRRRGGAAYEGSSASTAGSESNVTIPLGPGEWDEALGLPLCVACYNSDKMDSMERDQGWREEEFDYILQFLRTILLKYGASLVYSSASAANHLPTLIHSTLGIHSLLKRQPIRHNVIDREKVLIPPNWDSWGKIRVLREGFDVEAISEGWSRIVEQQVESAQKDRDISNGDTEASNPQDTDSPLFAYETTIVDPKKHTRLEDASALKNGLEMETPGMQTFLAGELRIMEYLKSQEELSLDRKDDRNVSGSSFGSVDNAKTSTDERNRVNEHIGPVQFNMGGIQVDAEDMLKRLKDREREETPDPETAVPATPEGKSQNEALANFFAGLMKRGGSNSPRPQGI